MTRRLNYCFQQIRDLFFILSGVLHIFFYKKKCHFLTYNFLFGVRPMDAQPLQPISGPCSIEIMYPREWRIAMPASLMQVEYAVAFSVNYGRSICMLSNACKTFLVCFP